MRLRTSIFIIIAGVSSFSTVFPQITVFPYVENFDGVSAPLLPNGWSGIGVLTNSSSPRSVQNCISATGNRSIKTLFSPVLNFASRHPDKLIFWERRSSSASAYRLEIRASVDGANFDIVLARFDTITTTASYVQRTIDLSQKGLNFQSTVQFQWILLNDSTNNTGVLRIDDVSFTTMIGFDLGISAMNTCPSGASRKDSITLSTVVKNYGVLAASNYSIQFFRDDNNNGLCEPNERFSVVSGMSIDIKDSLTVRVAYPPMKIGDYRFFAVIYFFSDENHTNDTAGVFVSVGSMKGDMLVNEIMYSPAGDEPEWVELVNNSSDAMNLKNWRISDNNSSTKSIITQTDLLIPPGSYIVIAKDILFASNHPRVQVVTANFSALNNFTPDAVVIYDARSNTIDSVMYAPSWGGQNGKSLERIDAEMSSTAMTNWGTSQDSCGSTPGRRNSIARYDCDVMIRNLNHGPSTVDGKVVPWIYFTLCNIGRRAVDSVFVRIYSAGNMNSVPETPELLRTITSAQSFVAGDSMILSESLPELVSGTTDIIVFADWWRDENLRNNRASISVNISYTPRSLIINEIMFEPLSGQNEWFELYNRSDQPIDLAHWTFHDKPASNSVNSFEISEQPFVVKSGEYAIIVADSTIFQLFPYLSQSDSTIHLCVMNRSSGFSFNNEEDVLVVIDLTGCLIDSVGYSTRWHHSNVVDTRGRSLERINANIDSNDPRNWSTCTNISGGTPGKANSIVAASSKSNSMISLSPNPFSPDGDGHEDFCIIRYTLPVMTSTLNIRIYDIKGRLIRTLANGELAGTVGEIVWDGLADNKQCARIGVYVIFLEATDRSSGKVLTAKAAAVVARKL